MFIVLSGYSMSASIFKLMFLLILFIAILAASYFFTRWYAKSDFAKKQTGNIHIVETLQLSPGKVIYIARIGEKYVSFVMSKDYIEKLAEHNEEEFDFRMKDLGISDAGSFKEIISKMKASVQNNNKGE